MLTCSTTSFLLGRIPLGLFSQRRTTCSIGRSHLSGRQPRRDAIQCCGTLGADLEDARPHGAAEEPTGSRMSYRLLKPPVRIGSPARPKQFRGATARR